jgi:alpha-glucoside transport system permease protein
MSKLSTTLRKWQVLPTVTLFIVVLVWSIPTVGLLITAFRSKDSANLSGWWDAVLDPFNQEWTLQAFDRSEERRVGKEC